MLSGWIHDLVAACLGPCHSFIYSLHQSGRAVILVSKYRTGQNKPGQTKQTRYLCSQGPDPTSNLIHPPGTGILPRGGPPVYRFYDGQGVYIFTLTSPITSLRGYSCACIYSHSTACSPAHSLCSRTLLLSGGFSQHGRSAFSFFIKQFFLVHTSYSLAYFIYLPVVTKYWTPHHRPQ